ncbi:MAG: helix-turn-helix transcriptional regulator [Chloroflexi bacterium]|nr:helix-turn-helix transcriptional regulator [Chloroflexota bacterium]
MITAAEESCLVTAADGQRVAQGRRLMLDGGTYEGLAATFHALADTSRAKVVYSLLWQELCTCDLAAIVGISESSVSQHLRVLRELRLVKSRRQGKMVFYSLDDDHIRVLLAVCLSHIRDGRREPDEIGQVLELLESRS